jgi:HNH endonuclease
MSNEAAERLRPTNTTRYGSLSDRLLARSIRVGDCLIWQGPHTPAGYGCLMVEGTTRLAHRLAYQEWVGPIPGDKQLDHLCRTRDCIEPTHLEIVTSRENTMRGESFAAINAAKTQCPNGHGYTLLRSGRRHRRCLECDKATRRRREGWAAR